jgi:transposase-like protein
MAAALFTDKRFTDDDAAREHLESIRWPEGAFCPHCGCVDRQSKLEGKSHRPGLYFCGHCRKQYTVTVGTVFERSKVALHKWVLATHLLCSSKKGMSAHQLHRLLGVTYKTAWFMAHRIREAMADSPNGPLGADGGTVEADETYWGNNGKQRPGARGGDHKMKVFGLVERGGDVRAFHVPNVTAKTLRTVLKRQVAQEAHLMTDEAKQYTKTGREFASHEVVCHSAKEYVRGDAHTNTIEGFFSILKRGFIGVYHHVGEQHLQRYVHEFDFRYNNRKVSDSERSENALKGISGKRLTYRPPNL